MRVTNVSKETYKVNAEALYQELLEAEIPFHEWYEWIKSQFDYKFNTPVIVVPAPQPVQQEQPQGLRGKLARMFSNTDKSPKNK